MSGRIYFNADHYHFDSSHTEPGETIKFETPNDQPIEIKSHLVSNSVQLAPKASAPTQQSGHNVLYTDNNDDLKLKKTDGSIVSLGGAGSSIPLVLDATGQPDRAQVFRIRDNNGFNVFTVLEDGHIRDNCASMAVFTGSDVGTNYTVNSTQKTSTNTAYNLNQGGQHINLLSSSITADPNFTHALNSDFNRAQFQGATNYQYWTVARDMIVDIDVQIKLHARQVNNGSSSATANYIYNGIIANGDTADLPQLEFQAFFLFYASEIFNPNLGAGGVYQHRLRTFERRLDCSQNFGIPGRANWEVNFRFQMPLYAMSWWNGSNGNQAGYNFRFIHNGAQSPNSQMGIQVEEIKWTLVKVADKPRI